MRITTRGARLTGMRAGVLVVAAAIGVIAACGDDAVDPKPADDAGIQPNVDSGSPNVKPDGAVGCFPNADPCLSGQGLKYSCNGAADAGPSFEACSREPGGTDERYDLCCPTQCVSVTDRQEECWQFGTGGWAFFLCHGDAKPAGANLCHAVGPDGGPGPDAGSSDKYCCPR